MKTLILVAIAFLTQTSHASTQTIACDKILEVINKNGINVNSSGQAQDIAQKILQACEFPEQQQQPQQGGR